jgi:hypothetical protein
LHSIAFSAFVSVGQRPSAARQTYQFQDLSPIFGTVTHAPVAHPGHEKKSILQKFDLMFSITYRRKIADFSIFSHDPGDA